ncbi:DnaJ-like protein subfamily C member 30, mitochondrial [Formica fusca]
MHKFKTLSSSKSSLGRLYSSKPNIKSSKNHYDTLKITPHATQNEVKSAYYKLSLQYHPDKNKSGYAREKFQDISDAYEVLGNHDLRKNYDRDIMIRQSPMSTTAQEPISYYKDKVYSDSSKIYNFDEWTQAHYGRQMHMARIRRNIYDQYKQMEQVNRRERNNPGVIEFILFLFTITIGIIYMEHTVDVPASKSKKHIEESNKKNN